MAKPKEPEVQTMLGNRTDLARVLDTSITTISAYDSKGLIVRAGGKYDLMATCTKVVKYLRMTAGNTGASDLKEEKLQEEIRQLRLQNAKSEGELVDIESVNGIIRKALGATADFFESLPDELEATGVIAPGMAGKLIKVLDDKREILLGMTLTAVQEDE
jgi:phage terminase Nu1 subunit (DNA packaging protein)